MDFKVGPNTVTSYKRLAYKPWFAIAELVDNSTQSYFNNREALDNIYATKGESFETSVIYDRENGGLLRVVDNAMGMSFEELEWAMEVGKPPVISSGRSKYGLGLKTSSCWIGNKWSVKTKKLGESKEYTVSVDVDRIARGETDLDIKSVECPLDQHYTIVEIKDHNRIFQKRTITKITDYLRSIYRSDLKSGDLRLIWRDVSLEWQDPALFVAPNGTEYKRSFDFDVDGKRVHGWVGVLKNGGRPNAGFSILKVGRVIQGWPDSWRPSSIFGNQEGGTNNLVNQRLVGEVNLDDFEVSHTKDDILWYGNQEEEVEKKLLEEANDYRNFAAIPKKNWDTEEGPSDADTQAAIDELRKELESPEIVDMVSFDPVLPEEVIREALDQVTSNVKEKGIPPTYSGKVGDLSVSLYLNDMSPNDPYVVVEATQRTEVMVLVNTQHPHWKQLGGGIEGVLNYLRHCTYDAIAESTARFMGSTVNPNTIKSIKDRFLRLHYQMSHHDQEKEVPASGQ